MPESRPEENTSGNRDLMAVFSTSGYEPPAKERNQKEKLKELFPALCRANEPSPKASDHRPFVCSSIA